MGNFIGGVMLASVFWGLAFWAYTQGHIDRFMALSEDAKAESEELTEDTDAEEGGDERDKRRKRRRGRARPRRIAAGDPNRTMRIGDSLGDREQIDMAGSGGEQQLSGAQIDATFDRVMPAIRRCFFLVEGEMPTSGVLRFGIRIESSGKVSKSNLTGPSVMVQGEPGRCLRKAVSSAPFPSFDGPAMQIKYPVRLE